MKFLMSVRPAAALLACCASAMPLGPMAENGIGAAAAESPPRPHRVMRPKRNSVEYQLSWGLAAVHADRAYARDINGSGVTVALIDTGIGGVPANMFGSVSRASTDLVAGRQRGAAKARHGQQTAGLVAAALDGVGTVGLAFDATLLWIRADIDGSCETQCAVRGNDLARGIDYALAHGAKVIGVPLTGSKRLRSVEAALDRAVAAGAIIVAAAGNDGSAAPSWPALYAANPRFSRSFVVAGASTPSGRMARWSNKAAGVERRYIAAPGENVIVDCSDKYCSLVSGTSYSVAYVAGALALILQAHPELAAPDAADILLRTATDLGRRGVDQVSGAGRLNVARAIRGARSVADVQGPGT